MLHIRRNNTKTVLKVVLILDRIRILSLLE